MRYSRTFVRAETLKTLYIALVGSHLDFASAVWGLLSTEQSESIERIQKRFQRYLHYKDFGYYEWSVTYNKLLLGYGLTTLKVRRDLVLLLFVRDLSYLLGTIDLYIQSKTIRARSVFRIPSHRTTSYKLSPINRAMPLYNKLCDADETIDIFYDSKNVMRKLITPLTELHN